MCHTLPTKVIVFVEYTKWYREKHSNFVLTPYQLLLFSFSSHYLTFRLTLFLSVFLLISSITFNLSPPDLLLYIIDQLIPYLFTLFDSTSIIRKARFNECVPSYVSQISFTICIHSLFSGVLLLACWNIHYQNRSNPV